jgi:hypothetical protein
MSMMKPDANQTTSMGMMEIMDARTGRLRESNALSVSVPSTRYGSFLGPSPEQKNAGGRYLLFLALNVRIPRPMPPRAPKQGATVRRPCSGAALPVSPSI